MRIIRPYGSSVIEAGSKERKLKTKNNLQSVAEFSCDKLVIAQWVSILNKINGDLRARLFDKAWEFLLKNKLISDSQANKDMWENKTKPLKTAQSEQGRWHAAFINEDDSADTIINKIYNHLYKRALCIKSQKSKPQEKRIGLIAHRAQAIAQNNVFEKAYKKLSFSNKVQNAYANKVGDIAMKIAEAKSFNRTMDILREAYAKVFGKDTKIKDIKDTELFQLHEAIKKAYKGIFQVKKHLNLGKRLPKDMAALFELVEAKENNKDVNSLIRQGKLIHYSNLDNSKDYKSTAGQIYIQQTEHLIRAWRYTLAIAARTLKSWADPASKIENDILGKQQQQQALNGFENKDKDRFKLLFGGMGNSTNYDEKCIFAHALTVAAALRHSTFHFKKLKDFKDALAGSAYNKFADELIASDHGGQADQLICTLEGIQLHKFLLAQGCENIINLLQNAQTSAILLPNFQKLITRDIGNGKKLFKEKPDLQKESNACKYEVLKMIYDKPFAAWLDNLNQDKLYKFIELVEKNANENTEKIHKAATAKINKILEEKVDKKGFKNINDLFYALMAETASAMGVQDGYNSNKNNARTHAETIEYFKRDLILIAFDSYLQEKGLDYLKNELKEHDSIFELKNIKNNYASSANYETWQKDLYLLIHLVPVDDINTLYHQMKKWLILAEKSQRTEETKLVKDIGAVLELYIAMHDAKFTGGEAVDVAYYHGLFENPADFATVFNDNKLPRGLREIMRFGDKAILGDMWRECKISHQDVENWQAQKNGIDKNHEELQKLHKKLEGKKIENFDATMLQKYCCCLQRMIEYRGLANRVNLVDHLRLYRLVMAVLARLTDFSGLWERDLYFVTLALIKRQNNTINDLFNQKSKETLENGQIVEALHRNIDKIQGLNDIFQVKSLKGFRNDFAHFNMLQKARLPLNLVCEINKARKLMAYDRKLKNAITKAFIDILDREGFLLSGSMENHNFRANELQTKPIRHLKHLEAFCIYEHQHHKGYLKMLASLLGSCYVEGNSIVDVDLSKLDWLEKLKKSCKKAKKSTNKYTNTKPHKQ